jgi:hypothetical protein
MRDDARLRGGYQRLTQLMKFCFPKKDDDNVKFLSLYETEKGVKSESTDSFAELKITPLWKHL